MNPVRTVKKNQNILLSIVIITRNAKNLLQKCLISIYEHVHIPYEIILIDNASNDGTANMIRQEFPNIKLTINSINWGVAPARNQGIKKTRGNFILILDDDTYIIKDAIDRMVDFLIGKPKAGMCGPQLIDDNGQLLHSCKRFPSPISFILNRFTRQPSAKSPLSLRRHIMIDWDHERTSPVDYIIGACQLFKRRVLDEIGYFDDKIFYGPEDIDICYRMWSNRWEVWYVHNLLVVHKTRRITKKNPFSLIGFRHLMAILRMFLKYRQGDFRKITVNNDRKRVQIVRP